MRLFNFFIISPSLAPLNAPSWSSTQPRRQLAQTGSKRSLLAVAAILIYMPNDDDEDDHHHNHRLKQTTTIDQSIRLVVFLCRAFNLGRRPTGGEETESTRKTARQSPQAGSPSSAQQATELTATAAAAAAASTTAAPSASDLPPDILALVESDNVVVPAEENR